jgi:hypothetical protein
MAKSTELIFVAAFLGIPLWLVARAWVRYLGLGPLAAEEVLQMRAGLALVSVTTILWFAVLALITLEDYSAGAKSIARNLSPGAVGLVNLALCAGGLVCSFLGRRSARESVRLRNAIALCSGCLMFLWLFIAANPH